MANTVVNGQTCLEKRGITERKILIQNNIYNGSDMSTMYSVDHENALSSPDSKKGKGNKSGGHTFVEGYFGKPKENPNSKDYRNFNTVSEEGNTIGGCIDIKTRDEQYNLRRFNREINEYSDVNEDAISNGNIHGKGTQTGGHTHISPNESSSLNEIIYRNFDTAHGGGGYDVAAREKQINWNYYNGINKGMEYNAMHENALSTPSSMKGKGSNSGGHTYFLPDYGKPKENPNSKDYSNFNTVSEKGKTIGNDVDITTRSELMMMRRFNYESNEYSDLNKDAISDGDVIGKGTRLYLDTENGGGGYDIMARDYHMMRNEWRKDLAYSKPLVDAEYLIQTEFKVSSYEDRLNEQAQESAEKAARKADKQAEKKAKKAAKDAEKAEKTKAKEERKQRKEMIKDTEKYMHLSNPMDNLANFNLSQWK